MYPTPPREQYVGTCPPLHGYAIRLNVNAKRNPQVYRSGAQHELRELPLIQTKKAWVGFIIGILLCVRFVA